MQDNITTFEKALNLTKSRKNNPAQNMSQCLAIHISSSAVGMLGCEEKALEPLLFAMYPDRFVDCNQWLYAKVFPLSFELLS